jgi:hypothetical protein
VVWTLAINDTSSRIPVKERLGRLGILVRKALDETSCRTADCKLIENVSVSASVFNAYFGIVNTDFESVSLVRPFPQEQSIKSR